MIPNIQTLVLLVALLLIPSIACPLNCASCNTDNQCSQCVTGYVVAVDNTCQRFVALQGCRVYSLSRTCAGCQTGYNLFVGACYLPVPNCLVNGPGNTCVQCNTNFLLYYGNCYAQSNGSSCEPARALFRSACVPVTVRNCLTFSNGTCTRCETSKTFTIQTTISPMGSVSNTTVKE